MPQNIGVSDLHHFFQITTLGELKDYLAEKQMNVVENHESTAVCRGLP
jgi:hypothetical protein